jgi:hypothetical protein
MEVVVRGSGVAASCCTHLLGAAGLGVRAERTDRQGVPALMVSARTQRLLCDVFQNDDLFHGLPRVEARIVAWGAGSERRRFEHSAVVVSELELLQRLNADTRHTLSAGPGSRGEEGWTIIASRPRSAYTGQHSFGSRTASVFAVDLREQMEASACWIESLACGWLFLLPASSGRGWLLSVGDTHQSLLSDSHLIAPQIGGVIRTVGEFPAYPVLNEPLCGPQWLACGNAALAFDPLCGDGTGNAAREAILAAAIIRAAVRGEPEERLLAHYRARLIAGFARHLRLCSEFYSAGRGGPWWDAELELIRQGIEYCNREIAQAPPPGFRLEGFELRAV